MNIPEQDTSLKVSQFGLKSREVKVNNHGTLEITATRWYTVKIISAILLFILGAIEKSFISLLSYRLILIIIDIFVFHSFKIDVIDHS
ncbi:hypothetical protein HMI01_12300 [Halolactibacillus miurensis]|uniref:Uncharacterized protein n=1 Tax=Halolactibacillus miurensis TaxID=306541 RepID=A0ABQ0VSV0_9BACI|nr:hypothetical protein HMI01_12300 [Halolactibacillus miurensis]